MMVQLQETFGGRPRAIEAALLSDGTLRVLAIAAAVHSVPPGSLLVPAVPAGAPVTIAVIDTSILCEFLDVPNMAGMADLVLPVAAILETGNHIAQNGDGQRRRACAGRFVDFVRRALAGDTPFTATPLPDLAEWRRLLVDFDGFAMRGVGLGDVSIVDVFEQQRARNPHRRVYIWSLDAHLSGYDSHPDP